MLKNLRDPQTARETMMALLPTCGTMAGIAIGLVGIIQYRPEGGATTFADEFLLISGLGFLLDCYWIFFAMRIEQLQRLTWALRWIDILFIASLTLMVFAGFVVAYEFM